MEDLLGVERLADDQRRPGRERDGEPAVAAVVLQRALDERHVVGIVADAVGVHDGVELHEVGAMGACGSFRQA